MYTTIGNLLGYVRSNVLNEPIMNKIKTEDIYKALWNSVEDSGNRLNTEWYYQAKASEHIQYFSEEDKRKECIDLGCGAGEILQYMVIDLNITTALDFSAKMIAFAKELKYHRQPEFICADIFMYLPSCTVPVWTTCGAINQFLDFNRICEVIRLFALNPNVQSFYLFDCIDPLRYSTLLLGSSFKKDESKKNYLSLIGYFYNILELIKVSYKVNFVSPTYKYSILHFGFAHAPRLWHELGEEYNLQIDIVSSRFFEYRYHVFIKKNA
jgi:SAM-dependent methyltransferase